MGIEATTRTIQAIRRVQAFEKARRLVDVKERQVALLQILGAPKPPPVFEDGRSGEYQWYDRFTPKVLGAVAATKDFRAQLEAWGGG